MKASDRTILIALAAVGLLAVFWLLVVSPKRGEADKLNTEAETLRSSIASLEADAQAGEAARGDFDRNYSRMVVLGKAVPSGHEEGELIVGLDQIGKQADVYFRSIELSDPIADEPTRGPDLTTTDQNLEAEQAAEDGGESPDAGAPVAAPVPATEASAASLPLGATIGTAGLGVMGWKVEFTGGFFDINSVLAAIDRSVKFDKQTANTRGRLVTVDGFSLELKDQGQGKGEVLDATMILRSYITPESEGVTLGATPQGPVTTPVAEGGDGP